MTKYDLYKLLKEELGNGSKDLVTRPSGETIRGGSSGTSRKNRTAP